MAKNKNSKIIPHLYVHFPFCYSKCLYCSFYSVGYSQYLFDNYLTELKSELKYFIQNYDLTRVVSLYFGGGTPTIVAQNLLAVYGVVSSSIDLTCIKEFTVECNPNDIHSELVEVLNKIKCTRVSVGVQSFDKNILKIFNREGLYWDDLALRFNLIRKFQVSIDLINGFYSTCINFELEHLNRLLNKFDNIQHISFYDLSLPEGEEKSKLLDENKRFEYEERLRKIIKEHHFIRYEVANYCKDNKKSLHNLGYWKYRNYAGLGPSAHSTINGIRLENDKSIKAYTCGNMDYKNIIKLSKKEQMEEYLLMGLRLTCGIQIKKFEKRFSIDFNDLFYNDFIKKQEKEKNIIYKHKRILSVTGKGMDILNKILLEMFVLLDKSGF